MAVKAKYAAYEIPFASILRPTGESNSWEKARFEVPALRWADLSQNDYGVALINNSKYGYDIHGNTIRLTLLRSPASDRLKSASVPDPFADRGKHTIRYSLIPHSDNWKEALVYRRAYEFNFSPYIKFAEIQQKGKNGTREESFIKIRPDNVVLTAFKQCEEKPECFILRVYEVWGQKSTVKIELPIKLGRVFKADLIEEKEKEIELDGGNKIRVDIGAHEILTLKIYPELCKNLQ